ncbi:MAG: hypothetical protein ACHQKY_15760 [Terriglobia bacterium]
MKRKIFHEILSLNLATPTAMSDPRVSHSLEENDLILLDLSLVAGDSNPPPGGRGHENDGGKARAWNIDLGFDSGIPGWSGRKIFGADDDRGRFACSVDALTAQSCPEIGQWILPGSNQH